MTRDSFASFVMDQLDGMEGLVCRPMFGGCGLYCGDTFFGILYRGRLYFWTSDATRPAYAQRGAQPFRPRMGRTQPRTVTMRQYYDVPLEVLEDRELLIAWAHTSIRARYATVSRPARVKERRART